MMDEKPKLARKHSLDMENREKARITGVNDVISFDLENVLLETDYGMMTIHGDDLHVRRLSVEKGEVDVDGCIDAIQYSDVKNYAKKGSSVMSRLFG